MTINLLKIWKNNRFFILFIFLMLVFRTSLADWNSVPTGSMKPTILEGDRIWVNKLAYDLKIPFTNISVKTFAHPKRGDIIIFESKKAEKRLVKRVIGLPGDTVSMSNNTLTINGDKLNYKVIEQRPNKLIAEEKTAETSYHIQFNLHANNISSNFYPVKIPNNYYLVLGDNRNNSADSRYIGFIPRDEIIGRTKHVVMSLNYDNYYLPRANRFLHKL